MDDNDRKNENDALSKTLLLGGSAIVTGFALYQWLDHLHQQRSSSPNQAPGHPVEPKVAITLRPAHGMQMTLHPRKDGAQ